MTQKAETKAVKYIGHIVEEVSPGYWQAEVWTLNGVIKSPRMLTEHGAVHQALKIRKQIEAGHYADS